jgi:hypothetical protein
VAAADPTSGHTYYCNAVGPPARSGHAHLLLGSRLRLLRIRIRIRIRGRARGRGWLRLRAAQGPEKWPEGDAGF